MVVKDSVYSQPDAPPRRGSQGGSTRGVTVVLAMLLLAAGCSSSSTQTDAAPPGTQATTTSTTARPTTLTSAASTSASTTSAATTTTTTTVASSATTQLEPLTNQAEPGLRFDYGDIVRFERVDGVDWIWFDRYTFGDSQGVELVEEPRWEMATDWHGGGNVNPLVRTYPLAPGATTLEIDPTDFELACGDLTLPWEFIDSDVLTLLEGGAAIVSLTFDAQNRVVLIRDQRTC